ncbi:hypothetical protein [Cupriavidus plantarum]|uniref:hypothetical protein n=1 Tax=Cupriavidus plantarum TaxID=942865 RepID=UPI000E27524D|nr:hypothetical protein [Cupriavidus plantarum]REE92643.1 hypothetical protein C7418_3913 [Cupriavidus plantarum]
MNRGLAIAIAALLALLGAAGTGAWLTERYRTVQRDAAAAKAEVVSLRAQLDSTEAGVITVTHYIDRAAAIRAASANITKELPRYVPTQADAACTVPAGFVRLHDAAAAGAVLDPDSGDFDAAPSGVSLSAVAGTVADNYAAGNLNAAALTSLQETLRAQGVVIVGEPAP